MQFALQCIDALVGIAATPFQPRQCVPPEDCRDVTKAYYSRRPPGHQTLCAEPLGPASRLNFSFTQAQERAKCKPQQTNSNTCVTIEIAHHSQPASAPLYPASMHQKRPRLLIYWQMTARMQLEELRSSSES